MLLFVPCKCFRSSTFPLIESNIIYMELQFCGFLLLSSEWKGHRQKMNETWKEFIRGFQKHFKPLDHFPLSCILQFCCISFHVFVVYQQSKRCFCGWITLKSHECNFATSKDFHTKAPVKSLCLGWYLWPPSLVSIPCLVLAVRRHSL